MKSFQNTKHIQLCVPSQAIALRFFSFSL